MKGLVHGGPSATSRCGTRPRVRPHPHQGRRPGAVLLGVDAGRQGGRRPGGSLFHPAPVVGGSGDRVVGQHRREERPQPGGADAGRVEQGVDTVDFRRRLPEAHVLEDVDAGRQPVDHRWLVGSQLQVEERFPIPDQQPGRVVEPWLHPLHEIVDAGLCGRPAGEHQGQFAPRSLGRVPAPGGRTVGETRHHPVLVDRQPRPPGQVVPPTEDLRCPFLQHAERMRRAVQAFVTVGRHHEREIRLDLPGEHQEAHAGRVPGAGPSGDARR